MATSQQIYSVEIEENLQAITSYDSDSGEFSTAVESTKPISISSLQHNEVLGCKGGSCWSNIFTSGKLFQLITKVTGLWNPRKKCYALLCAILAVLNILSLLVEILIPTICGPFEDRCVAHSKPVTNFTKRSSNDNRQYTKKYQTLAFGIWNALSDTVTFTLLVYTLWRVQQKTPSLSPVSVHAKVSSREWLLINTIFIVCSLAITAATAFQISVVDPELKKIFGMYGTAVLIVYLTAFISCYVFAALTCALGHLTDDCFQEICNAVERNLNDIIAAHQKMVKELWTASQSLNSWFLVHWLMFGMYCVVVFAFSSINVSSLSHFTIASICFMSVAFLLNLAVFLVPCVYASRVTWKCEELLFKVNNMSSEDWNRGHPFRDRINVNEFIFYAERSKGGFRICKMTFGSSGTWISVFFSLLGLGIRFLAYIQ